METLYIKSVVIGFVILIAILVVSLMFAVIRSGSRFRKQQQQHRADEELISFMERERCQMDQLLTMARQERQKFLN